MLQIFPAATPKNAIQSPPSLLLDGFPPVVASINCSIRKRADTYAVIETMNCTRAARPSSIRDIIATLKANRVRELVDVCSATLQPSLAPRLWRSGNTTCVRSVVPMCASRASRALGTYQSIGGRRCDCLLPSRWHQAWRRALSPLSSQTKRHQAASIDRHRWWLLTRRGIFRIIHTQP